MARRKTLADELAELFNPTPKDVDPEAAPDGDTAARLPGDDEQLDALVQDAGKGRKGRLAMRADINLADEDETYRGRKTSRKALYPEDQETDNAIDSEEAETDSETNGETEGDEGVSDADRDGSDDGLINGDLTGSGSEGGEGEMSESESQGMSEGEGEESEGGSEGDGGRGGKRARGGEGGVSGREDDELAQLEEGYRQLQEHEQQVYQSLKDKGRRDVDKGLAIRQQQRLYERMLELRILLQKALMGSNRLPTPTTTAHLLQPPTQPQQPPTKQTAATDPASEANPQQQGSQGQQEPTKPLEQLQSQLQGLQRSSKDTFCRLLELHDAVVAQPQALCHGMVESQPVCPEGPHTTLDELWAALDTRYNAVASFRDVSVDKWHARAVLTSGSAALQGSLKALNQSISRQISNMMRDPHKLLQRSRVLRSMVRRLGEVNKSVDADSSTDDEEGSEGGHGGGLQGANGLQNGHASKTRGGHTSHKDDRDLETFDDGEFYQQLLKEFLEYSGNAGNGLATVRPAKKRKLVDRKASKGRKIRYNVQDKLVNFMTAVQMEPPVFAEQLFANLFSSGVDGRTQGRR